MTPIRCVAHGVGQAEEGVCLLIELGPHRILLDCGLDDPAAVYRLDRSESRIDVVFCSHAHPDHSRGLWAIAAHLPEIPIYMSEVTAALVQTQTPTGCAALPCQTIPWRSPLKLPNSSLQVQFFPAGHLPGAASILLTYVAPERTYTVLYTGDFCRTNLRLTEGLNFESLRGAAPDVLILEGSYGVERYPRYRQQEQQFLAQLDRELTAGRSIVLLAPMLGLAQEILVLLRSHHHFTGRDVEIWVDEPIAQICDTYLELLAYLPTAIQNFARHQSLFWDAQVLPRMHRCDVANLSPRDRPCLVVSDRLPPWLRSSTLATGSWCCFVPQRELRQLHLDPNVLHQLPHSVIPYCLTDHSDGPNTVHFIHNLRPQHIILCHAPSVVLEQLTNLTELQNRYQLHLPSVGSVVELPVGEKFLTPSPPSHPTYIGELSEWDDQVTLSFDASLTEAAAWSRFADTGMVEARWQGKDLLLKGLSQRELLQRDRLASEEDGHNRYK